MVAVLDYYPNKDGYIEDGHVMAMCAAEDVTMVAGSLVQFSADPSTAGYITVKISAARGDASGICLRTPTAIGDTVPVCFQGVVKCIAHDAITIGSLIASAATTISTVTEALSDNAGISQMYNAGTAHILGTALQAAATAADEILVLVGRIY
jgi:hypothetical protein